MNHNVIYKAAEIKFGIKEASITGDDESFILTDNLGNQYTEKDFTKAELDFAENALKAEAEALVTEMEAKKNALLEKLGITEDEAKLLLS